MKKTLGWMVIAVVFALGVLCAFLYASVKVREGTIAEREPVTSERLEQLAGKMQPPRAVQTAQTPPPTEATAAESDAAKETRPPEPLPTRLERAASPEVLEKRFARGTSAFDTEATKVFEGVLRTFGAAEGFTWQVGEILLSAGKWDDARRYFYQALDESTNWFTFGQVCARLAWLEEDPEKAARFLELSIDEEHLSSPVKVRGDRGTVNDRLGSFFAKTLQDRLSDAVELCRATGSEALANHYLERLRIYNPQAARRFENSELRIENREGGSLN